MKIKAGRNRTISYIQGVQQFHHQSQKKLQNKPQKQEMVKLWAKAQLKKARREFEMYRRILVKRYNLKVARNESLKV